MKALVVAVLLAATPALAAQYWSGPWLCEDGNCVFYYADGLLFHGGIAVATIKHGVIRSLDGRFLGAVPPEPAEPPRQPRTRQPRCWRGEDDFGTFTQCE